MPTTDAVSGGSNVNYVGSPKEDTTGAGLTADMDTFLQLLVAQMQYQDPLEPKQDSDFVAQLAQLTSVEQMQQMNQALTNTQGFSAVGKYAYAEVLNSISGVTEIFTGHVDSVAMYNGTTYLVMEGNAVPIHNILMLSDTPFIPEITLPDSGGDGTEGEDETVEGETGGAEGETGGAVEGEAGAAEGETVEGGGSAGGTGTGEAGTGAGETP